jgi:hypothetical protein
MPKFSTGGDGGIIPCRARRRTQCRIGIPCPGSALRFLKGGLSVGLLSGKPPWKPCLPRDNQRRVRPKQRGRAEVLRRLQE